MVGDDIVLDARFRAATTAERVPAFMRAVYGWMAGGLVLTAATADAVASAPAFASAIASDARLFWGLAVAQLAIVVILSARVDRLAAVTAATLFIVYSALTGVTLSVVLLAYTGASVSITVAVAASMFGAMAVVGTTTTRNLSGLRQFLVMGLIGVVLASLAGLVWPNGALQFVSSLVGVVVFAGLAAYDAQRLAAMAEDVAPEHAGAYAVTGALALYLDAINLFLSLLRLGGGRRRL